MRIAKKAVRIAATSRIIEDKLVMIDDTLKHMRKKLNEHQYEIQDVNDEIIVSYTDV